MPDRGLYKANGPRIAQLRGEMSEKDFAAKCGRMSIQTLRRLEAGQDAIQGSFEKVAKAHPGITWEELRADPTAPADQPPINSVGRGFVTPGTILAVDEVAHAA